MAITAFPLAQLPQEAVRLKDYWAAISLHFGMSECQYMSSIAIFLYHHIGSHFLITQTVLPLLTLVAYVHTRDFTTSYFRLIFQSGPRASGLRCLIENYVHIIIRCHNSHGNIPLLVLFCCGVYHKIATFDLDAGRPDQVYTSQVQYNNDAYLWSIMAYSLPYISSANLTYPKASNSVHQWWNLQSCVLVGL